MKRALRYALLAFWLAAAASWGHDAVRLFAAFAQGNSVTIEPFEAMAFAVAATFLTGVMLWNAREAWRATRRRKPVGVVEVVLRIDRSKFERELAAMKRASDELRERMRANERGLATTPAIVTGIALLAVMLAVIDRNWLDALVFAALAGLGAAWTYLDTATEGRRR